MFRVTYWADYGTHRARVRASDGTVVRLIGNDEHELFMLVAETVWSLRRGGK